MTLFELFRGYIYNQDNSFSILLMNLFKQRYISSVKRCYYLNKFISSAFFYEHYVYVDNTFKEVKKKNQKKKNTHCTISHVIARLTIFTYAFCHMRVENLMKESGLHYSVFKLCSYFQTQSFFMKLKSVQWLCYCYGKSFGLLNVKSRNRLLFLALFCLISCNSSNFIHNTAKLLIGASFV